MARCLDPGGRYAWSVGVWGEKGTREGPDPGIFEVAVDLAGVDLVLEGTVRGPFGPAVFIVAGM